jgi:FkbM family methyltransferase
MPDDVKIIATYHGIEVLQAPMLSPKMIASLHKGKYERREIACGLAGIPDGSRLLEMGAGSGIVGAVMNRNLKLEATLSIEANPNLLSSIEKLHKHNGLGDAITLRHGVVMSNPDAPDFVTFNVDGNFLGSSLQVRPDRTTTPVQVPVLRYDELKKSFPHDAIMMDIEGAELEFLRHADLSGVNVFVGEMHRNAFGREGMKECRHLLEASGLMFHPDISKTGVHVYRRM